MTGPGLRWHTRALVVALVNVTLSAASAPHAGADTCGRSTPIVNKMGFRPGATVYFDTAPSPDGTRFPAEWHTCVVRAFDAWTTANAWAGSWVRFMPGRGGIVVRFDAAAGMVLHGRSAGAWTSAQRAADGFLERADVWLSSNPHVVSTCQTVTKVLLHELGHLHGLADIRTHAGRSVMNPLGGADDRGRRVPMAPSRCDAAMAAVASFMTPRVRADVVAARH